MNINETIAEEVMGWVVLDGWWIGKIDRRSKRTFGDFDPLGDMKEAWMVVDSMLQKGYAFHISVDPSGMSRATFVDQKTSEKFANQSLCDTENICNAALLALGVLR